MCCTPGAKSEGAERGERSKLYSFYITMELFEWLRVPPRAYPGPSLKSA